MLWGGRGTADKYHWPVWGALSVLATLDLHPLTASVLSQSMLLSLQAALQGAGPELHSMPKPLRFQFSGTPQRHRLSWACVLCLPGPEQLRQPGAWRAHSPWVQCTLSPPRSQTQFPGMPIQCALIWCTLCLFWGADLWLQPSLWMLTIQNHRKSLVRDWKPVCSLVGDAVPGAEFAPFPSPLPPASGGGWVGAQPAGSSLELLSPSFVLQKASSAFV